jgi:Fur family ferric uptake transcriptional regulator/Fur family peroxide stress response transcriptional regulator
MMNYAQLLKEHELKATFQRTQILEVIEKYGHIAIERIYEEVSKIHASLSLATIYKNILLMVERGVLTEVPIIGQKSKYEIVKEDHLHLVCTECGEVVDKMLDDATAENTLRLAETSGFVLDHRQVNLYGICKACRSK